MLRSWGYILMVAATLVGVVALLWPGPPLRTVEQIAIPERPAPTRSEPSPKAPKQSAKPAPPKKAPPAVIERLPQKNTTTGRAAPADAGQAVAFGR